MQIELHWIVVIVCYYYYGYVWVYWFENQVFLKNVIDIIYDAHRRIGEAKSNPGNITKTTGIN